MLKLRALAAIGALFFLASCGDPTTEEPCAVNPCQNGGTCSVDEEGRAQCMCAEGYAGLRCASAATACNPDPCENGGTCSLTDTSFACECPSGFAGERCETEAMLPMSCTPNPCKNGGTCDLVNGTAACTCTAGFAGPICAVVAMGCTPNPCKNGGSCVEDGAGDPVCTCVGDFGGATCSSYLPPGDLDLSTANTQGRTCAQGGDMVSYSVVGLTQTTATLDVAPTAGCLAVGDEVLLINLQGTFVSVFNTGNWELLKVQSVVGSTVTFAVGKQRFYGNSFDDVAADDDANLGTGPTNQRVMLQRVPKYPGIVVPPGRALTASAWNGTKGGVFAMRLEGGASFSGAVTMSGKGYRGGDNTLETASGNAGESIRGVGPIVNYPNTGGGGGGVANCPGISVGVAGGGGGHGTEGDDGGAIAGCAGLGGIPYGDANLSKIFFGSGGGAGGGPADDSISPLGGYGGAGGGIVIVLASGDVAGNIFAAGQNGYGDVVECTLAPEPSTTDCWDTSGPGGGGAGGSILVQGKSSVGTREVSGGLGGDGVDDGPDNAGNGGSGLVSQPM